jgi:hypothetical protein
MSRLLVFNQFRDDGWPQALLVPSMPALKQKSSLKDRF